MTGGKGDKGHASYRPAPVDTSHVQLTAELIELIEVLSENAHDAWAAARLAEGWTYGSKRNDRHLHHPCLVPYDELTEVEKDIDRTMVLATVQFILAHGYELRRTGAGLRSQG
jgi:hypothetical protein